MSDRDIWTIDAMEKWGGSFVKQLGALARHADAQNLQKIKATWPEYWADYEAKGMALEKENEKESKDI